MHKKIRQVVTALLFSALIGSFGSPVAAQSLTTGSLEGTVTDQSGAVVAGATVTLTNNENGAVQTATTSQSGQYRFSLLKPAAYTLDITQAGFQKFEQKVSVPVGQPISADARLVVGQSTQTVEVSTDVPVISPEPSQSTNYNQAQIALLPSGGSDLTNIAFTSPGVVVNLTGGYGNFTANGLPATSNLFTVNGENDMDPYFNINNSGATNLTLGQNEIQEATVSSEPYSGQFGQLAGAQVTYVTKSGSNQFHGNLVYYWNGRAMNSNDWFNNYYGTSRPFSNQNQWAASLGGPIFKDKTFFFFDTEGMKFIIPNNDTVTIPSPQFATAVLNNLGTAAPERFPRIRRCSASIPAIPGASGGQPLSGSSPVFSAPLAGFDPTSTPCALQFTTTPSALASEWILAFRIDQRLGDKDNIYFRYKQDHGIQPTTISPVSPVFDAQSNQPSWDTQLNETHVFGPRATNSFMATLSFYQALFALTNETKDLATFPYDLHLRAVFRLPAFNNRP